MCIRDSIGIYKFDCTNKDQLLIKNNTYEIEDSIGIKINEESFTYDTIYKFEIIIETCYTHKKCIRTNTTKLFTTGIVEIVIIFYSTNKSKKHCNKKIYTQLKYSTSQVT